jgi:hypothetical protein
VAIALAVTDARVPFESVAVVSRADFGYFADLP